MFAHDRDLLVLEPALLRDVGWAGQRVLDATGTISGATLTLAAGSFTDAGVAAGSVALVDGLAVEILAVVSATEATVSLIRARRDGPGVAPPAATSRPVRVYTFGPQIEAVHRQILTMAGIDPDATPLGATPPLTEASITNPNALVRLEALGALHLIYAGAAAPGGTSHHAQRAEMYRQRFAEERARVPVFIDLDADGVADARRSLTVTYLSRA